MTAYWLDLHASYRCRDSGACCTAGWPIPVETIAHGPIDAAVARGELALAGPSARDAGWLHRSAHRPAGVAGVFAHTATGACVFHRGGAAGCAVHATLGPGALPASCAHFPRICLIDDRGVHVTLSHYCPTAAGLLFAHDGPVRIVEGPAPVPGRAVPEGLDVREAWPPFASARVLMDLDGYAAWERYVVDRLAGDAAFGPSVEAAVSRLRRDAAALARWTPRRGLTLTASVEALGHDPSTADGDLGGFVAQGARARMVADLCPPAWAWPGPPPGLAEADAAWVAPAWPAHQAVVRRYLAATAFASWVAWQGLGARAMVEHVALALDVLRVEAARACARSGRLLDRPSLAAAVRQADLLLRHHVDSDALAALATAAVRSPA